MTKGSYKGRIGRVISTQKTEDKRGGLLTLKLRGKEELLIYEGEVKVLSIFKKRDIVKVINKESPYFGFAGEVIDKNKVENGFRYDIAFDKGKIDWHDEDELEELIE